MEGEALFQTHENLEHLAMMEKVLGPLPQHMIVRANQRAEKYFRQGRGLRLDWPEGATSRESIRAVWRLPRLQVSQRSAKTKTTNGALYEFITSCDTEKGEPQASRYSCEEQYLVDLCLWPSTGNMLTSPQWFRVTAAEEADGGCCDGDHAARSGRGGNRAPPGRIRRARAVVAAQLRRLAAVGAAPGASASPPPRLQRVRREPSDYQMLLTWVLFAAKVYASIRSGSLAIIGVYTMVYCIQNAIKKSLPIRMNYV
ncbi:serine threonine-protein kinase [Musa troglodytarum]|uniref:Serine threonine-protein kinase n=1 Tax=Musa troglodytarum TaxID=320322 RepID=A0A9E7G6Z4_9LILI|nr:serine threonine-protein kinase [Musa troglodytarum]